MFTLHLKISGIHCDSCIKLITLKVKRIKGVTEIRFTNQNGNAEIISTIPITIHTVKDILKNTKYKITAL